MRNLGEYIVVGAFVSLMLFGVFSCERAKWKECRRVHPGWYCFQQMGR